MTQDDGFEPLEPANLIVLGDKKKQSRAFGGLLIDIVKDEQYPEKVRYLCVGRDGEEYEVAGNAALARRIKKSHIGCLIKLEFKGWQRAGNNSYKILEVQAQPRSRTTEAQIAKFPRWNDFAEGAEGEPATAETAETAAAEPEGKGEAEPVGDVLDF